MSVSASSLSRGPNIAWSTLRREALKTSDDLGISAGRALVLCAEAESATIEEVPLWTR